MFRIFNLVCYLTVNKVVGLYNAHEGYIVKS